MATGTLNPTKFFKRNAYAVVILPNGSQETIQGIRLRFTVEKLQDNSASKGTIDLFNLSPISRGRLEEAKVVIELHAGYGSDPKKVGVLSKGNIYLTHHKRAEADIVTTCEFVDGGEVRDVCRFKGVFGPGRTNRDVVNACVAAMQAKDPTLSLGNIQQIPVITYRTGRSFNDMSVADTMDDLMRDVGWRWGINNGVIFVTSPNNPTGGVEILLSKETGLIGVPSKANEGTINGGFPYYRFESLLNPLFSPTSVFKVQSEYVPSGTYVAYRVTHTGDNFEGDYKTIIEAAEQ